MKQVIVIRTDLEMGKGKMCSQAAHASLSAAMECKEKAKTIFEVWYRDSQAKIVLKVNSEEDLLDIYMKVLKAKIPYALIKDAAHTQLKEPAYTTLGIGPWFEDGINKITGELKLL